MARIQNKAAVFYIRALFHTCLWDKTENRLTYLPFEQRIKSSLNCRQDTFCNIYFLGKRKSSEPWTAPHLRNVFNLPVISITHLKSIQNTYTNGLCWYFKANLHLKALTASQTLGLCKPVCKHWISVLKPFARVGSTEVRFCTHSLFEPRSGSWQFCEAYASLLPHEWRTVYLNTHRNFLRISNLLSIHDFASYCANKRVAVHKV